MSCRPRREVITSVERRRRWSSVAERIRLVEGTLDRACRVSFVAPHHGISPSLPSDGLTKKFNLWFPGLRVPPAAGGTRYVICERRRPLRCSARGRMHLGSSRCETARSQQMTSSANRSTFGLLLCAAALAGVIVLELVDRLGTAYPATAGTPSVPKLEIAPLDTFGPPPPEAFSVIGERPLFVASRRPFKPRSEPSPVKRMKETKPLSAKLVGVVLGEQGRFALVRRFEQPKTERLTLGQTMDGWRLEALEPDRAVFYRGDQIQILQLHDR